MIMKFVKKFERLFERISRVTIMELWQHFGNRKSVSPNKLCN